MLKSIRPDFCSLSKSPANSAPNEGRYFPSSFSPSEYRRTRPSGSAATFTIADHAWSAIVNVAADPDGLVRRYSLGEKLEGKYLPSLGALLAGDLEREQKSGRIDFSILTDSLPVFSYVDVLHGDP